MGDVGRGPLTLWGHNGGTEKKKTRMLAKIDPAQSGAIPFEACQDTSSKKKQQPIL